MRLFTVAALIIGSVPVFTTPASAAGCEQALNYSAQASADLIKIGILDPGVLGLKLPKVADLTMATTRAKLGATETVRSTAKAEYLAAHVLGLSLPRGPLDATVAQSAPPTHQEPVRNKAFSVDLGVARAGTGELNAHARWADGMGCGTQTGPGGSASAALLGVSVLPGGSGALIEARDNLASQSATATVLRDGRAASAAATEISLSSLEIAGKVNVKVISPPSLAALATGRAATSAVEYKSPILEISGAGIPRQELSGLGKSIDLPMQTSALGPLLSGLPLPAGLGQSSILRLTIGDLKQRISDDSVTASAASLRLQVLVNGASQASVLDLGIGLLEVSAQAPKWTAPTPGNNPGDCGTPGCQLPVTGMNAGIALGAGILLFVLGRFLFILSARRRT